MIEVAIASLKAVIVKDSGMAEEVAATAETAVAAEEETKTVAAVVETPQVEAGEEV